MYSKLFARITESSLMEEPIPTRYVFVMLLAIADAQGYVIGTDVAIARRLNMPLRDLLGSIDRLMEPDAHSNSQAEDGRRVIRSDGERGYKIVNYGVYRDLKSAEGKREYMREYMRDYRAGKPRKVVNTNLASPSAYSESTMGGSNRLIDDSPAKPQPEPMHKSGCICLECEAIHKPHCECFECRQLRSA
jgi:hypothetical protein